MRAKIDTEAQVNVMSKRTADSIEGKLEPSSANLISYLGTAIPVVEQVMVPCFYKKRKFLIKFKVTTTEKAQTVLVVKSSTNMELIQTVDMLNNRPASLSQILEEFRDTFGDIGCVQDEHHIKIDDSVEPVIVPPRTVSLALRDKLKTKLDQLMVKAWNHDLFNYRNCCS